MDNHFLPPDEATALLVDGVQHVGNLNDANATTKPHIPNVSTVSPFAVLPISLLAALAMAATAATTIFAYASLLCQDPTHCQDTERNIYAGAVAAATCLANICALLVLGPLEKLSGRNDKAGLVLWLVCRSASVATLALGVQVRSIIVALSGRFFEGLASDNILHFNLNAIYVQTPDKRQVSDLLGTSLALYMIGISVSPALAGMFTNFTTSFTIASIFFAVSLLYLGVCVRNRRPHQDSQAVRDNDVRMRHDEQPVISPLSANSLKGVIMSLSSPLQVFCTRPVTLFPGVSLLLYNTAQSYVFSAIMVHTSVRFGFSSQQNGFLISIAHAVSSLYLIFALFAAPYILKSLKKYNAKSTSSSPTQRYWTGDVIFALLSLSTQATSLTLLGLATQAWQIYLIIALCALGFAAPSFIKSHVVRSLSSSVAPRSIAALAMMETFGSLMAPVILGGWQTLWPGDGVFFVAAAFMGGAAVLFGLGVVIGRIDEGQHEDE